MRTTRLPAQVCLACGYTVDAHSALGGHAGPEDGDVAICVECGYLMVFNSQLRLRRPTPDELRVLEQHPMVQQGVMAIGALRKTKHT